MPWGPSSCEFLLEFWQAETFLGEVAFQCQPSNQSELRIWVQTACTEGCLLLLCFWGVDVFGLFRCFFQMWELLCKQIWHEHLYALVMHDHIDMCNWFFLISGFRYRSHMQYTYWILHNEAISGIMNSITWFREQMIIPHGLGGFVKQNATSFPFVRTKYHLQI